MASDEWPQIVCKRFDGESFDAYQRRSARIREIITNFRLGRYGRDIGDVMENKLLELQTPALEHAI